MFMKLSVACSVLVVLLGAVNYSYSSDMDKAGGIIQVTKRLLAENNMLKQKLISLEDHNRSTQTSLEKLQQSLQKVMNRTKSFGKSDCHLVDSASPGGDLFCPIGYYVAGAKNLHNNNYTLDMIYCCSPS